MSLTNSTSLVQTATVPNYRTILPQSDISVVPFPPNNPSIAFITTAPQVPRRPTSTHVYSMLQGFEQQAKLAFSNLEAALALGGAKPHDVTKLTVSLAEDYGKQNKTIQLRDAIARFFTDPQGKRHAPPIAVFSNQYIYDGSAQLEVQAEAIVKIAAQEPEQAAGEGGRLPSYDEI